MKTLIYGGTHQGVSFSNLVPRFDRCIGFEADPALHKICSSKFINNNKVTIVHGALTTFDGQITFNVCDKKVCNSIGGKIHDDFRLDLIPFSFVEKISVPAINLYNFCSKININYIDMYVSDLQGMDFEVLKTLKPLIDQRKIGRLKCEVFMEDKSLYPDLPSNYKGLYDKLLNKNYKLVGVNRPPGGWKWWADCIWKLK